jgi:hypothetical protein
MRQEIRVRRSDSVEITRDREKCLRAEEPALRDLRQPAAAQGSRQLAARFLDSLGVIDGPIALAAARLVVTGKRSNSLQQRGFPGAILADDDGDRVGKYRSKPSRRNGRQNG